LIHQGEFDQFLAVEISAVLAELLQQPMAILIRQAADHLQEVLGELGIGYELRLSPLGRTAASGEKPPTRSPGSTHRSQRVWRPAGHGASELRDDGYLDEIGPTPSPVPRKPVGRRLKDTQAKTEGASSSSRPRRTAPEQLFRLGRLRHHLLHQHIERSLEDPFGPLKKGDPRPLKSVPTTAREAVAVKWRWRPGSRWST